MTKHAEDLALENHPALENLYETTEIRFYPGRDNGALVEGERWPCKSMDQAEILARKLAMTFPHRIFCASLRGQITRTPTADVKGWYGDAYGPVLELRTLVNAAFRELKDE